MRWFKRIFKRKSDYTPVITQEMREKALETRRLNSKIDNLERQLNANMRLQALQDIAKKGFIDDGTSKSEEMLLNLLMGAVFKNPPLQNISNASPSININIEQNEKIAELLNDNIPPQFMTQIKSISDEDLLDIRKRLIQIRAEQ